MDTAGEIKRANETSTEQQMKETREEIKKLKFHEPLKFKRKANEDLQRPSTAPSPPPRSPTLRK